MPRELEGQRRLLYNTCLVYSSWCKGSISLCPWPVESSICTVRKLPMKAPCVQKDTSQESKQTLLSRDKTEGFVPTSTWALINKRGGKCVLCFPSLPESTESVSVGGSQLLGRCKGRAWHISRGKGWDQCSPELESGMRGGFLPSLFLKSLM